MNTEPVERIFPDDPRVKPQTIAHHKARYELAIRLRTPGGYAADLGCGTGYGTDMLRKAGYDAKGVDISDEAITYALTHFPESNFKQLPLDQFRLLLGTSLVTMFEVIEHLSFTEALTVLEEVSDKLTKNGVFILSTPRDINEKYNHFHKSHWDYNKLKEVLSFYFPKVLIIGQDWDTAEFSYEDAVNNDFYIAICRK